MDIFGRWLGVIGICLTLITGQYITTVVPLQDKVKVLEEKVQEVQVEQGKVLVELKYINLNLVELKALVIQVKEK